jgi:RNA polymerase sigma-B factor
VRYHRAGDLAAREELVERLLPFARELARRYAYTDEPFDDLLQVAYLGLIKAIDRFDPDRGAKFTSFAAPTILGELKRHFRDKGWAVRVPRDLQERALAVIREAEALSKELGRSPKPREVAHALGCSVEEVLEAQQAAASYEAASLDAPTARDDNEGAPLLDMLGGEDDAYELVEEFIERNRRGAGVPHHPSEI